MALAALVVDDVSFSDRQAYAEHPVSIVRMSLSLRRLPKSLYAVSPTQIVLWVCEFNVCISGLQNEY